MQVWWKDCSKSLNHVDTAEKEWRKRNREGKQIQLCQFYYNWKQKSGQWVALARVTSDSWIPHIYHNNCPAILSASPFCMFYKIGLYILEQVLVHRRYRISLNTLPSPPQHIFPHQKHTPPHQNCALDKVLKPTLTHHYHPKSILHARIHSRVEYPMRFDKCIITCIYHYSITQSSFIALNIICALPNLPGLPPHSWPPLLLLLSPYILPFPEYHVVGNIHYVALLP